ncbi:MULTISPECIES: hypothetical protein [unclassified Microcoleus]|uniref:hypothetical protein n=1 Tax=unclassified Microcoleus TaxID=2642155 RepID=UPI002FD5D415
MSSPTCEQDPTQPKCQTASRFQQIGESLINLSSTIENNTLLFEKAKANDEGSVLGAARPEKENFYDGELIKGDIANISEFIVDLIITNGDKPEKIHRIRLETAKLLKELKALDKAEIEPEIKKQISDRMKVNMSAILEEILAL